MDEELIKLEHPELIIKDEIREEDEELFQLHEEAKEHQEDLLLKIKTETSTSDLEETADVHENDNFQTCLIKEEEIDQFEEEENVPCTNSKVVTNIESTSKTAQSLDEKHVCNVCSKSFHSLRELKLHCNSSDHSEEHLYACTECDKKFINSSYNLRKHLLRVHSITEQYDCEYCEETFQRYTDLVAHRKDNHFTCCGKSFKRNRTYREHLTVYHTGKMSYKCEVCGKLYAKSSSYYRHIQSHNTDKKVKCNTCNKTFANPRNLEYHLNSHAKKYPYKCNICDKSFADPSGLNAHKQRHHDAQLYSCNFCAKKFQARKDARIHTDNVHKEIRSYRCDVCDKIFKYSYNLKVHRRTHTKDLPYKCDQCDKAFAIQGRLKSHYIVHSSKRPFKCDKCSGSYKEKQSLAKHKRKYHLE